MSKRSFKIRVRGTTTTTTKPKTKRIDRGEQYRPPARKKRTP